MATTIIVHRIGRFWHLIEDRPNGYWTRCVTGGWEAAPSFDRLVESLAHCPRRGTPYRTRKAALAAAESFGVDAGEIQEV